MHYVTPHFFIDTQHFLKSLRQVSQTETIEVAEKSAAPKSAATIARPVPLDGAVFLKQSDIRAIIARHVESRMPFDHTVERQMQQFGDSVAVLSDLVRNGTDDEKLFSLVALRHIEPRESDIVPDLVTLLNEGRVLSLAAAETLGVFGSLAVDAIPWLERQLDSGDDFDRCLCAGAVLKISPSHARALDVLRTALDGDDEFQRRSATYYLSEAGML